MKTVRINIQNGIDRNNMIIALANARINVMVEEVKTDTYNVTYWVVFQIPENNIEP